MAFTNGYYVEYFFVVVVAFFPWFCWFVHKTKKCLYIRRCLPRFQECLTGLSDLNDNRRKAFLWIMLKNSLFIWRQREPKISSSDDKIEQCKHRKVTWNSASNLICVDFFTRMWVRVRCAPQSFDSWQFEMLFGDTFFYDYSIFQMRDHCLILTWCMKRKKQNSTRRRI